jgi:hypothetical protein
VWNERWFHYKFWPKTHSSQRYLFSLCNHLACQCTVEPHLVRYDLRFPLVWISISLTQVNSLGIKFSSIKNFLSLVFKSIDPQRNFKWMFHSIWSIVHKFPDSITLKWWAWSHSCTASVHGWCSCPTKFINPDSSVAIDILINLVPNLGTCNWQQLHQHPSVLLWIFPFTHSLLTSIFIIILNYWYLCVSLNISHHKIRSQVAVLFICVLSMEQPC